MGRASLVLAAGLGLLAACGDDDDAQTTVVVTTATAATPGETVLVTAPEITEAPTTTEATTTTEPVEFVKAEEFFGLLGQNTPESLLQAVAMTEPGTAAFQYANGIAVTAPYDTAPQPGAQVTGSDGTYSLPRGDGTSTEFSQVVFSQNGLIVDFARNGVPVSQSVYPSGQEIPFEGGAMTIVDFRLWDDNINVLYLLRNDGAESLASLDVYVAEGRQFDPAYELSIFPNPRPGATQLGYLVFAGAPRGGVVNGFGGPPDYNPVMIQVPA